jgi:hypothetical protein
VSQTVQQLLAGLRVGAGDQEDVDGREKTTNAEIDVEGPSPGGVRLGEGTCKKVLAAVSVKNHSRARNSTVTFAYLQ